MKIKRIAFAVTAVLGVASWVTTNTGTERNNATDFWPELDPHGKQAAG